MTAEDNLRQQYQFLGLPSYGGFTEILSIVGLSDTGKKGRKLFAQYAVEARDYCSACGDPDFMVLDKLVNGLDSQGIIEMRELILKLNREKQITVLVYGTDSC